MQCWSVPVVAVRPGDRKINARTVAVPTGLRWWPCCCPVWPCADRGGRNKARPRISACLISACKWPLSFSVLLWLFMSGLHPHPGPSVNLLVHASAKYTGPREGTVFKRGADGMGYYSDCGGCTLELAPLIAANASLPSLPIQLFSLLGLGLPADPPRYPSGPSGNGRRRTRGGRNSKNGRHARQQVQQDRGPTNPFVGNDVRRADVSHKDEFLLAYDSCNANAWRQAACYLEATGADGVLFQETKVPPGLPLGEAEQTARNSSWTTSLQPCNLIAAGGRSAGMGVAVKPHVWACQTHF